MAEFHIHIDASELAPPFEATLVERLSFRRSDFSHQGNDDKECFAPVRHLTFKCHDRAEFDGVFDKVVAAASQGEMMRGYVEGEVLPFDDEIESAPFDPAVPLPFRIEMRDLSEGEFRETEIHLAMSDVESDPRLFAALEEMGFLCVRIEKTYGLARIWTVQGRREELSLITPLLRRYLSLAGGAARASIKEERVVRFWISGSDVRLPPVIREIQLLWPTLVSG